MNFYYINIIKQKEEANSTKQNKKDINQKKKKKSYNLQHKIIIKFEVAGHL